MPTKRRLRPEDRAFFAQIADVVFSNPFSAQREALLRALSPPAESASATAYAKLDWLAPMLDARLAGFDGEGTATIDAFDGEDRVLVEYAVLLRAYLHHSEAMDDLIGLQTTRGAVSVAVPFAEAFLDGLLQRGFSQADALHYLALLYQFRRAFYFIAGGLIGDSPPMRRLRQALWNNLLTTDIRTYDRHLRGRMEDFSTVLLGETGTGKGAAAAAIGRSGFIPFDRAKKRFAESFARTFISLNLSQFAETLIESELFGHRKGAFTGAVTDHQGVLERCSPYGALFLDEIGDISIPIQIKLLQVLQERTFMPVGSHDAKRFEGRVIAATHRSIDALRAEGAFRHDFFYRLCSDVIVVPTLRERLEESPAELEQLVALLAERMTGSPAPALTAVVLDALKRDLPAGYPWPGNVRELEQAVRRILLTGHYGGDLRSTGVGPEDELIKGIREGALDAASVLSRYCALLYRRHGTYEEVARRTGLDRRTVKKYVLSGEHRENG